MTERIELTDLKPAAGATKTKKRVGRGRASGMGKTSSRGNNGEGQRAGRSSKRGFEGGQMPGYRQMPKLKGFKNFNALVAAAVNVGDLENVKTEEVTLESLKAEGKVSSKAEVLRILGKGELKKALTINANHFSSSAIEKIEKAGGKAQTL